MVGIPTVLFNNFIFSDSTVYFNNESDNATVSFWDFGNGQTSNGYNTQVTYTNSGTHTVTLTVTNLACNLSDTYSQTVNINLVNTSQILEQFI